MIRTGAIEDLASTVSIADRIITNLGFADDIDGLMGETKEPTNLAKHLDKNLNSAKTKLMTGNMNGSTEVNGQMLVTFISFKYLESVITDDGFKPKIFS